MTDAIVYTSNAGHTKKYAELLAKKTGLKAYSFEDAQSVLKHGSNIIYMGWVRKGKIQNYRKAAQRYHIELVCAVGLSVEGDAVAQGLAERNKIEDTKVIYLQGGLDYKSLKGMNKFVMKQFRKVMVPRYEERDDLDEVQLNMLRMFRDGGNCVSVDRLAPVLDWYHQQRRIPEGDEEA